MSARFIYRILNYGSSDGGISSSSSFIVTFIISTLDGLQQTSSAARSLQSENAFLSLWQLTFQVHLYGYLIQLPT